MLLSAIVPVLGQRMRHWNEVSALRVKVSIFSVGLLWGRYLPIPIAGDYDVSVPLANIIGKWSTPTFYFNVITSLKHMVEIKLKLVLIFVETMQIYFNLCI